MIEYFVLALPFVILGLVGIALTRMPQDHEEERPRAETSQVMR